MNTQALKKKIGPLPAWAWVVVIGGAIGAYLLYRRSSSSSSSTTPTSTAASQEAQVDPTNPLGLTYAQESADEAAGIDPDTGETYAEEQSQAAQSQDTAGTGGGSSGNGSSGGGGGGGQLSSSLSSLDTDVQGLNSTLQSIQSSGGLTDGSSTTTTTATAPAGPGQTLAGEIGDIGSAVSALNQLKAYLVPTPAAKQPALKGSGAIRAPSGATKPTPPAGYETVGLGSGNWEFKPIKTTTTHTSTAPKTTPKTTPKKKTVSGKKTK